MANIFPTDFEEKLTMAQDDYILFSDSEDGNKIKKAQYKNLKGEPGTPGADGQDGEAATITVGTTTTGAAGSSASVTNSGTSSAAVLNFVIPQGAKGEPGEDGADGTPGADGEAATITVGTTTTLPAGSSATVTNVGTSSAAVLNFGIPKGDAGTGSGDVIGPGSSTDGHLAVFDGATGKIIKDGGSVPTSFAPDSAGSEGQVLTKGASGYDWATVSGGDVQVSTDTGNLLTTGVKLWLGDKADFDNLGSLDSNTIYAPIEGRIVICDFTQSDCGFVAGRHHDGVVTGRDSNGLSMYCTQDTYKGASWIIPSNIFSNGAIKKIVLQLYANNTGCGGGIGYNLDTAYSRVWWQGNMCDWTGTVHTESLQSTTPASTTYTFTIDLENGQQWTSLEPEAVLNLTSGEVSAITTHWNSGEIGLVCMLVRSSNSDTAYIQKARFYF